jgi:hypothetical protein
MEHPVGDSNVEIALDRLSLTFDGCLKYGWHHKSAGCRVTTATGEHLWLRLQSRASDSEPNKLWFGLQEADRIPISNKPQLKKVDEWNEKDRIWRAELMTYIPFEMCSPTCELKSPLRLESTWYKTLRESLDILSRVETARVNARQDLITRRLRERFGNQIEFNVEVWSTAHGDIHWANLSYPECWIFDWEAWGLAPLGLDAATLYCFSLMQPEIAEQVSIVFKDLLETPDGIRSQLFLCSELMRMSELYGDHPHLYPYLQKLSKDLLLKAPSH